MKGYQFCPPQAARKSELYRDFYRLPGLYLTMLSLTLKHSLIFFVALIFAFNLFIVIILLYAF